MYDHTGISFSAAPFSCPWDSGQYGYIYWTRDKVEAGQGKGYFDRLTKKKRAFLEEQLKKSVELLNDYVGGNVYGYVIEDSAGEDLGSCWGFYGDYEDGALKEARARADYIEKEKFPLLEMAVS